MFTTFPAYHPSHFTVFHTFTNPPNKAHTLLGPLQRVHVVPNPRVHNLPTFSTSFKAHLTLFRHFPSHPKVIKTSVFTRTTIRRSHTSYPLTVSPAFLIHLVFFKSFQTHITIFTSLPTHFTVFNNWTQFRFNALSNSSHSVYQTQITFQTLFTLSKPTSVFTLFSIHTMLQSYPSLGVPVFSNPFHIVHNVPNPLHGVHTFQT